MWLANADGSGTRRLTDGEEPVWAPNGREIALVRERDLYVLTLNGGERNLSSGRHPTWASGGRLAYDWTAWCTQA